MKTGEIKEFKAMLIFPESSRGEFMIEAKSESNSYALLDPWWESNWTYKLPVAINASKYNFCRSISLNDRTFPIAMEA